jgi:hypothetical protein
MTARRDRSSGRAAAIWHVLVGPPLRARDVSREQITPVEGLSALSLDASHNHLDTVLTRALRDRPDVIVARVPMRVRAGDAAALVRVASTGLGRRRRSAGRTSRPEDAQARPARDDDCDVPTQ